MRDIVRSRAYLDLLNEGSVRNTYSMFVSLLQSQRMVFNASYLLDTMEERGELGQATAR